MALTQKETSLLKDLTKEEQLCIARYTNHSEAACDPNLKTLFSDILTEEQEHLDTLNDISAGGFPQTGYETVKRTPPPPPTSQCSAIDKKRDAYLCQDALSSEKHVSSEYDTAVFEFVNADLRRTLNHIQTEEQRHGEMIYNYMKVNNMYK
jgi:rubrerythrin